MTPRQAVALAVALVALPWLLLWPAPLVFTSHLLSAPDEEAVQHLWGLWAAWQAGDPITVTTDRISWPIGFSFVLIDPGNVPWFGLGHAIAGPAAGYNLVLLAGIAGMGVAGALGAKAAGGDGRASVVGAVAAMACPALLSNSAEGITESFSVGWVGVALAALVLHLQGTGWAWGAVSAVAIAGAVWGGPYNALWVAIACGAVGLARIGEARRTVPVGLAGAVLSAPILLAAAAERVDGLPGTASRQAWVRPILDPTVWRGGNLAGADLLDPWLPAPLTDGLAVDGHSAYLGVVVLGLAIAAVVQDRRRWPWLAGAAGFVVLSLGLVLAVHGHYVTLGGGAVLAPVGFLAQLAPPLLRFTRWYRAAAVAGLLLAPLVGLAGARRPGWAVLALLLDACLLAPRAWPVRRFDARPSPVWAAMTDPGAVAELPPVQWAFVPEGGVRDQNLLEQAWHGRPTSGTFFNLSGGAASSGELAALLDCAIGKGPAGIAPQRLAGMGYRYVVVDRTRFKDDLSEPSLEASLGAPILRDARYLVYRLPDATGEVAPRFPPWRSPVPPPGPPPKPQGQEGPGGHHQ